MEIPSAVPRMKYDNLTEKTIILCVYFMHSVQREQKIKLIKAVPWLRSLIAGISQRRPGFEPGSFHVGCVAERVALGQISPSSAVLFFRYNSTMTLHTHITPGDEQ
jgi:hypothetical protein